jgi:DNA (cytosine-5)-methyltransferase 1
LETTCNDYSRADGFNMLAQPISFGARMSVPQVDFDLNQTLQATNPMAVAQPVNIYGGNKRPDRPEGGFYVRMDEATSKTLDAASGLNPTCSQGGTAVIQPIAIQDTRPIEKAQNGRGWNDDGTAYTVDTHATQGVAQAIAPALTASNDPSRSPQSSEVTQQVAAVHAASMAVRRLTPVECERLQGFPDNYTNIPWRKKDESPDGPRYKALGNSMAVPVMRWIGKRIDQVEKILDER